MLTLGQFLVAASASPIGTTGAGAAPAPGAPLVRRLVIGDAVTGLVVVPQRPGRNLVHLSTERVSDLEVGGRRYAATRRPDESGRWAVVDLPAGRSRLQVSQGGHVATQYLDTGTAPPADAAADPLGVAGPDGEECLSAGLGAALGGSRTPLTSCPAAGLRVADAAALRSLTVELAARGVRSLAVVSDSSPRSVAAERIVTEAGRTVGVSVRDVPGGGAIRARQAAFPPVDALLSVGGHHTTGEVLAAPGRPAPRYGTYLAPWLLDASLISASGGFALTALPFDPGADEVLQYLSALRRVGPVSGTESGLAAYLGSRHLTLGGDGQVRLYAATSAFEVMPMGGMGAMGDMPGHPDDHPQAMGWLGGGALTPVSGVLRVVPVGSAR